MERVALIDIRDVDDTELGASVRAALADAVVILLMDGENTAAVAQHPSIDALVDDLRRHRERGFDDA